MMISLPEKVVLKYARGACEFGFGQRYAMKMITEVLMAATPT
jgi:hypothetical protein